MARTLRPPRSHQPLTDAASALDLVSAAASRPPRRETIVVLLDDQHIGTTLVVVNGTTDPDDVLDVAALVAEATETSLSVHAAVLATVRITPGLLAGDVDRWLDLLDLFDDVGLELLDWFVVCGSDVTSLRDVTGMPALWRGG